MIEIGAMIRSTVAKKCRFRSLFAKDNMQGMRPQRIFPVGSGKDTIYTDRPSQAGSGCSVIGALFLVIILLVGLWVYSKVSPLFQPSHPQQKTMKSPM
jgi:hypothetical protein